MIFESRVLRRIFGLKRNEVIGRRRTCIMRTFTDIHNLYSSPHIPNMSKNDEIKKNGIGRACSTNGNEEERMQGFVGTPEGNTSRNSYTAIPRWEDNIEVDLRGTLWSCKDWIDLDLHRDQWRAIVNTVMNLQFS
jgi:hypothetical protein